MSRIPEQELANLEAELERVKQQRNDNQKKLEEIQRLLDAYDNGGDDRPAIAILNDIQGILTAGTYPEEIDEPEPTDDYKLSDEGRSFGHGESFSERNT